MNSIFAALGGRKVANLYLALVIIVGVLILAVLGKVSAEVAIGTMLAVAVGTGATNASVASDDKAKLDANASIESARLYAGKDRTDGATPTVAAPATTTPEVPRG